MELDTLPPTQVTDPELTRLVQIAEGHEGPSCTDLPKAGQDAIQQLAEGLRRQATARAPVLRSAGKEKDAKDEDDGEAGDGHRGGTCGVQASVRRRQQQRGQRLGAARDAHETLPPMIEYDALVISSPRLRLHVGIPGRGSPVKLVASAVHQVRLDVSRRKDHGSWMLAVFVLGPAQRNKWGYRCIECSTFWCDADCRDRHALTHRCRCRRQGGEAQAAPAQETETQDAVLPPLPPPPIPPPVPDATLPNENVPVELEPPAGVANARRR